MKHQLRSNRDMLRRKRWYRFFRAVTLLMLLMIALGIGLIAGLFAAVAKVLPSGEELSSIRPPSPTRVLASDGTVLARFYSENRELVPISRMGYMQDATLAIEDIRFMEHPGIDPRGIIRAMVKNVASGNSKEGASTITQQLARNLYLSRTKTITRKLQEMILALELERRYSKQEILETYLNQVYYGNNTNSVHSYGCQVAAQNYFGKNVEDLTLAEAALLAGLPKNPRDYNPYRYPKAAKERRHVVLMNMLSYGLINRKQYEQAVNEPVKLAPEKKLEVMADAHAPYFVRFVIANELEKIYGQETTDYIYRYGIDIHTTLDPRMQKKAEEVVTARVNANRFRNIDDGALIAIDPLTGHIKAMVGGTDFTKDQYNIVVQGRRQPGSAFKPFVYTAALLHGYTPTTRVNDSPASYRTGSGGPPWSPRNSDGSYRGPMQLQQALWASRNAAAAAVANDVGIRNVIKVAHSMGIKHPLENYLTTALGASVVSPLDICSGYGTLANSGVLNPPVAIVRVTTPDGSVLYEHSPTPRRAIPTEIADTMQQMMRGVIERGTARSLQPLPFPASGKTGTTNSYRDAWFIGYTDDLCTAVWVGNRQNKAMNRTFGATVPAPIWKEFMLVAQPIMAAEHDAVRARLATVNNLPELKNIDTTPTPYIVRHGRDTVRTRENTRREEEPVQEEEPLTARDRTVVRVCTHTRQRATSWCPDTAVVTYYRGQTPSPPAQSCSAHTGPGAVPPAGRDDEPARDRSTERGVVISVCAETGKIASSQCPTVLRRRFKPDAAPTETCPLHRD